ncbi:fumarate/nitrate reduction transcriptional regulator Fnr [Sediminicurvatus halobius]|uniref:Transcriptional regulator FNR n=1 Tax=Sediminicurvatus halobius TaxID=2182432 RepID=A0A2U2MZA5_9GAMM|nr:fumarate/nitrate reduction transcriptional regulator Fnr [Spiribacter halobius]PWG62148.1 transcriptional regulator FNR [Spiribacter halobius]UEX77166.1 fumarate/nitrate reduction transcriptional regulator Fnr [Spiribacter halobius]
MTSADVSDFRVSSLRSACTNCSLVQLCLPVSLSQSDVALLDDIVQRRRPLQRNDHLYREGDDFHAIYAVRSGALKTYTVSSGGEEQVTGFHLPGELVGLDAINTWRHPCSAEALETTSVCELPFERLEDLASEIPGLQRQLLRLMSREIFSDQEMLFAMARRTAEERLAILLLSLSDRFARRGLSATRFRLPMARSELGNYLGLAPETMSRLFRRFRDQGWLSAEGREVRLTDVEALHELAGRPPEDAAAVGQRDTGY